MACLLAAFFVWRIKSSAHSSATSLESIEPAALGIDSGDGASVAAVQVVQLLLAGGVIDGNTGHKDSAIQWDRPYPYQAFAFILGFLLIFRCFLYCC